MEEFLFWWSIISTILGVIFLIINVAQLVMITKEKEIHKAQVKVWQHHANGIQMGLFVAIIGKYSGVEDLRETVKALQQDATALHSSLNEERLFTDKEVKERQLLREKENKELQERYRQTEMSVKTARQ